MSETLPLLAEGGGEARYTAETRAQRHRLAAAVASRLESKSWHWSAFSGYLEYEQLNLTLFCSAIIALTTLDAIFVLSDLSTNVPAVFAPRPTVEIQLIDNEYVGYDFLKDPRCLCTDSCPEDPKILEVFELLSISITGRSDNVLTLVFYIPHLIIFTSSISDGDPTRFVRIRNEVLHDHRACLALALLRRNCHFVYFYPRSLSSGMYKLPNFLIESFIQRTSVPVILLSSTQGSRSRNRLPPNPPPSLATHQISFNSRSRCNRI